MVNLQKNISLEVISLIFQVSAPDRAGKSDWIFKITAKRNEKKTCTSSKTTT